MIDVLTSFCNDNSQNHSLILRKKTIEIKIAISSDNHLDVNKVNINDALNFQARWLNANHLDYYLYAGDLFNNFLKTRSYFEHLQ